jgi:Ni,Fe-hydrogenase maturation factor
MGIYDGCLTNSITVYSCLGKTEFINKVEGMLESIKITYPNSKVVIVDISHSVSYGARFVIYENEIPQQILNYKHKWVIIDGKWIREGLLDTCEVCGCYKEIATLSTELGHACWDCFIKHDRERQ